MAKTPVFLPLDPSIRFVALVAFCFVAPLPHILSTVLCLTTIGTLKPLPFSPVIVMRFFETLSVLIAAVFAIPTQAHQSNDFPYGGLDHQLPIAANDDPITRTRLLIKTHYEINIVSTVYRTRTYTDGFQTTTKTVGHDPVQTLSFSAEGTGCDTKACTICRLLNDCSDDEKNWYVKPYPLQLRLGRHEFAYHMLSSSCNEAYYCNECGPEDELSVVEVKDVTRRRTCSLGPGRTIPCDELNEAVAHRHEVFKYDL